MRFTVDRSKWRCGGDEKGSHGEGETFLLNDEGYRCCLGFVGHQLGCPDDKMRDEYMPSGCHHFDAVIGRVQGHHYFNTDLADEAVGINDDGELSRGEREQKLTALFARHGHELVFDGEYED